VRRIAAALGLAAAVAVPVAVAAPHPAGAAAQGVVSGWWWREQPADGTLPAPADVPEGGVRIASDPLGTSAIAAVRFAVDAGEVATTLTLDVAAGTTGSAVVSACPATASWRPVAAGGWASRPTPDC
jgi:hypothetical protein